MRGEEWEHRAGNASFLATGTNGQRIRTSANRSLTREMHSLFVSIICCLTIVPSSERRAHPLGMGSNINDWDSCQRSTVADTPSSTLHPLKGTSFSLYYFFPSKGRLRSRKKCHYKWRFLIIGQNFCPISLPIPFTCILPLSSAALSGGAESQPPAVCRRAAWVMAAVRPSMNNP